MIVSIVLASFSVTVVNDLCGICSFYEKLNLK